MRSVTEEEVVAALKNVLDPELRRCLIELGMVKDLKIKGDHVGITVSLTVADCPMKGEIKRDVEARLLDLQGVKSVDVKITAMTKKERAVLFEELTAEEGREFQVYHGEG